jgi:hypothetical protein
VEIKDLGELGGRIHVGRYPPNGHNLDTTAGVDGHGHRTLGSRESSDASKAIKKFWC